MSTFVPGQRWFSTAEPELGLGTVLRLVGRSVQIVFTGSAVVRHYATGSAPLSRALFRPGDQIRIDGQDHAVTEVIETQGLVDYLCGELRFAEGQLDPEQPVSQADSRLLNGRVDRNAQFEFRLETLRRRAETQSHPGWGVLGARIDLIPHQLRVAEVAAARRHPRLLLADEVGLGKTIEACLIIAQQIASGRAGRVLILLPESLVHQWFVELLRRFNLRFSIFDEERCESMELGGDPSNPFEDEQGIIAATTWLANDGKRREQLLAAGWDLLVVDEAHHLGWQVDQISPEYALVEALAAQTAGVVLLTATPEQLGRDGHFARLRLLDPDRYSDLAHFLAESDRFTAVSEAVERLLGGETIGEADRATLRHLFVEDEAALQARLASIEEASDEVQRGRLRQALIDDLVDRHGVGRSMVRNRRQAVGGFPPRQRKISPLESYDPQLAHALLAEFLFDVGSPGHAEPEHDYTRDPRLDWLLSTLEQLGEQKCLVLCRTRAKVQALEEALRLRSGIAVARFHEDMNLLQRDRNAVYFADPEGARILIASEIGAEGRNFQFAQHLLMWDLPIDPDMLEQRIGRLDRIGQKGNVHIHLAAIEGSAQHTLLRWLDEGLDAFEAVCADGRELLREFGPELIEIASNDADFDSQEQCLASLIERTRERHATLTDAIQRGRDRLLELASQRGTRGGRLLESLRAEDALADSDDYALRLLEQFGVHHESLGGSVHVLDPEYLTLDAFEEFKNGPRQITLNRATALARDDLLFLRPDHPLVLSAQELLLSAETGNATFLIDEALPPRSVVLEAVFVLECIAERKLHVQRFLPAQPQLVAVDTRLQVRQGFMPGAKAVQKAGERLVDLGRFRKPLAALVPPMLNKAKEEAEQLAAVKIEQALGMAEEWLGSEIERLQALAKVNPSVKAEEIQALEQEREALLAALPGARPRLDAIRLTASVDFLRLAV
ncbi:RNA polymerase-associated protein RapA [Pseudomarimonas arenosa]|uniref:RNA polymerase-associated protein RapA n=1 Tax=Pseudomarimonas arenosa TaxID=2774145 RepID=A0AAW3ZTN3_9GAMM|nr:RNA polymerase-associated protein RapA [Pseudomarimonas arenosa]MBD8527737.1 RNA polymerase-associated protein RapA [Pseudomarimonas arenosa]